jgi:hypothetical protein
MTEQSSVFLRCKDVPRVEMSRVTSASRSPRDDVSALVCAADGGVSGTWTLITYRPGGEPHDTGHRRYGRRPAELPELPGRRGRPPDRRTAPPPAAFRRLRTGWVGRRPPGVWWERPHRSPHWHLDLPFQPAWHPGPAAEPEAEERPFRHQPDRNWSRRHRERPGSAPARHPYPLPWRPDCPNGWTARPAAAPRKRISVQIEWSPPILPSTPESAPALRRRQSLQPLRSPSMRSRFPA